jgi:hypothetical protein
MDIGRVTQMNYDRFSFRFFMILIPIWTSFLIPNQFFLLIFAILLNSIIYLCFVNEIIFEFCQILEIEFLKIKVYSK